MGMMGECLEDLCEVNVACRLRRPSLGVSACASRRWGAENSACSANGDDHNPSSRPLGTRGHFLMSEGPGRHRDAVHRCSASVDRDGVGRTDVGSLPSICRPNIRDHLSKSSRNISLNSIQDSLPLASCEQAINPCLNRVLPIHHLHLHHHPHPHPFQSNLAKTPSSPCL